MALVAVVTLVAAERRLQAAEERTACVALTAAGPSGRPRAGATAEPRMTRVRAKAEAGAAGDHTKGQGGKEST